MKTDAQIYGETIREWVVNNFGESEADDPSWSIDALAEHLAEKLLIVTDSNGTVTTHDIKANGNQYILEWTHSDENDGYIAITESCDDPEAAEAGSCDGHETYDFAEVV